MAAGNTTKLGPPQTVSPYPQWLEKAFYVDADIPAAVTRTLETSRVSIASTTDVRHFLQRGECLESVE